MLIPLAFPPGIFANGTQLQAVGRWYDGNLVSFIAGTVRPWGGWEEHAADPVAGLARAMLAWRTNAGADWIAIGTHSHLYVVNRVGAITDITPIRRTQARTDPISTTDTDATVTITDASHGATVGDTVKVTGAAAVGGITLSGFYVITEVTDANTIKVEHSAPATSTAGPGGGAVTLTYQITPGAATAVIGGGYGQGAYGEDDYGESAGDPELVNPATVWTLDTFGELLVGCNNADGKLYRWDLNTATPAAVISGAPVNCRSLVVTEHGHLMALGAGSNGRVVQWSDAQDDEEWTAGATTEAGSFPLQTAGVLMCGRRTRGGIILLTNQDAWLATYQGLPVLFSFDQIGVGCGIVSQGAVATAGTTLVAWMSRDGFWTYDGDVRLIPCEVSDRVFRNLNLSRLSHVTAYHRAAYGEIVWHYPSANSEENDRYAAWSYREGHWSTGALERTCGVDKGIFPYPLAVDGSGNVWRQETGYVYTGASAPFIESGPIQLAFEGETPGERVFTALDLIPDENALGDVEATFYGRMYPTGSETTFGPYTAANPTNVRFTARHLRMRLEGDSAADWRVGAFKLDVQLGGLR